MQIETLSSPRGATNRSGVTQRWYTADVATSHPRIQVTEDPELARALRAAAPHLRPGLPRSQQVRELALVGARHLAEEPMTEERREELLNDLASYFEHPETAPWDWDVLRDVKKLAWRFG
jgi:FPC/CPF motif-containing protein YcgG